MWGVDKLHILYRKIKLKKANGVSLGLFHTSARGHIGFGIFHPNGITCTASVTLLDFQSWTRYLSRKDVKCLIHSGCCLDRQVQPLCGAVRAGDHVRPPGDPDPASWILLPAGRQPSHPAATAGLRPCQGQTASPSSCFISCQAGTALKSSLFATVLNHALCYDIRKCILMDISLLAC